jgi:hypothetical protein
MDDHPAAIDAAAFSPIAMAAWRACACGSSGCQRNAAPVHEHGFMTR